MRKEYPRPHFKRHNWVSLDGEWNFVFDDENQGLQNEFYKDFPESETIRVPYAYETELSGINNKEKHNIVWYNRTFKSNSNDSTLLLHFGAVDYMTDVYINGQHIGSHQGGNTSFSFNVTKYLSKDSTNEVTVRVFDDMEEKNIPRGKQYWKVKPESIYYTKTTGIWQTVWLEEVPTTYIKECFITPDIDKNEVRFEINLSNDIEQDIMIRTTSLDDNMVFKTTIQNHDKFTFDFSNIPNIEKLYWSPENPTLIDVEIQVGEDIVETYFGLRKIETRNDRVYLNNDEYYMRLVLDQGYYRNSLLTSPSDDAIIKDILLTKEMGFNGVRKHQKIEEEKYLYYADKYGLLVWGELPSAYAFNEVSKENLRSELKEMISRDYNHPSIVAWVPINESWGVSDLPNDSSQREFLDELYFLTKKMDPTRLVISNDGWEHTTSDLFTIHDYESKYDVLHERYQDINLLLNSKPGYKSLYCPNYKYKGEPVLVTEFGGISFVKDGTEGWGYSSAKSEADFEERFSNVVKPIYDSPFVNGFCYTQLTDVEQEINGLLTYDRVPKIPLSKIKKIITNFK